MHPFSRRTLIGSPSAEDARSPLGRALHEARGRPLLDLTVSNPTSAGLPYAGDAITHALATPYALVYEPDPLGLPAARACVAADYALHGIPLPASHVAITASTSEAYAVLFKMLCDPGDEVLVPAPSYPLLAWLAAFEGVALRPYPLAYAGRWHVDLGALARAVTPRTRAIVVVSPNNPTGSYLGKAELDAMLGFDLPIVCDEVFGRYPLANDGVPDDRVDSVLRAERGLVFALSGLSKLAGLPQMKLGWIACAGDEAAVKEALARLEIVLDAYLSVGAPVQHALPALLQAGVMTRNAIHARTRENLAAVKEAASRCPAISVLDVEGGWYATLRVPATRTDEAWALELLARDSVYVHPGYFFDMTEGAHLVVSLLTPPAELAGGMARLAARVGEDA